METSSPLLLLLVLLSHVAGDCTDLTYPEATSADEKGKHTIVLALITGTWKEKTTQGAVATTLHTGSSIYAIRRAPSNTSLRFAIRLCETAKDALTGIKMMSHVCELERASAVIVHQHSCRTEARIAAAYNMPMMSVTCEDPTLSDKTRFPTFTRVRPQPGGIAKLIVSLLGHFNWTKVTLVSSAKEAYYHVTNHVLRSFKRHNITVLDHRLYNYPYDHPRQGSSNDDRLYFKNIVRDTHMNTRIYVLLGLFEDTLSLVHAMDKQGLMTTGKYFVVGGDVLPNEDAMDWVDLWNTPQNNFQFTGAALNSYVHISLSGNPKTYESISVTNFEFLRDPPFNITNIGSRPVRPHFNMAFLFDAVTLYINAAIYFASQPNFTLSMVRDGRLISERLRGRNYLSAHGYLSRIDENGDTQGNYTVFRLTPKTMFWKYRGSDFFRRLFQISSTKEKVGKFLMNANLTGLPIFDPYNNGSRLVWVAGHRPLDEPPCGFNGSLCIKPVGVTQRVVPILAGLLFLVLLVVLVFLYRNHRLEQELDMLLWKVDFKDLSVLPSCDAPVQPHSTDRVAKDDGLFSRSPSGTKADMEENEALLNSKSCSTLTTRSAGSLVVLTGYADLEFGKLYGRVATYKKQIVSVKSIVKQSVNVNRVIKKELKLLRDISNQTNQNITKFLGACVDEGNICVIWEYCERGSLQDILYNESLSLGSMFIDSLACDLINGVAFLHDSELRCHGNLKSSNCVVDSRWTLKLTDFGLAEFTQGEAKDHLDADSYFYGLFWTAPELLRFMVCRRPYSSLSYYLVNMAQALKDTVFDREVFHAAAPDYPALMRADIYALGIILYEIYRRQRPYSPFNDTPFEIVRRVIVLNDEFHVPYRPKLSELSTVEKAVTDCIAACWSEHPCMRPTAKQIRNRLKDIIGNRSRNIFDNMMNLMENYAKNLECLVNERTGQLVEEKKRTEELLFQMLPVPVAEQLKRNKRVEAEAFDSVTIYFSDVVGFTELSAESTPFEVVQLLNDLYTTCDRIIANYDVYKVETIGDAYMVVSGVPQRYPRHAAEIADMSMDMLKVITSGFTIRHRPQETLKLRIGINSGACCAGVVGTKMPRFCLFGDTVNVASRMESTGESGRIHISEQCKNELDQVGNYIIIERGEIAIKGRGNIRTFWLFGRSTTTGDLITPFESSQLPTSVQDLYPKAPSPPPTYNKIVPQKSSGSKGGGLMRSLMPSGRSSKNRTKKNSLDSKAPFHSSSSSRQTAVTTSGGKGNPFCVTEIMPKNGMFNSVCTTEGAPV